MKEESKEANYIIVKNTQTSKQNYLSTQTNKHLYTQ